MQTVSTDLVEQAIAELNTIGDVLRWAISQFNAAQLHYGHGSDNAWDEALWLIGQGIHIAPNIDERLLNCHLTLSERRKIAELIQRRVNERIPAAYLTEQAWFAGLEFYIDPRVLIPRSPIAELIEHQFHPWIQHPPESILDLCTGSGCIAVATAVMFPFAKIDAADISKDALEVAAKNCEKHDVTDQVALIESDLFNKLPDKKYDIIVSNPPYVSDTELSSLPEEYQHEPRLGFYAEDDGLAIVDTILREAPKYLNDQGILIVEVGNSMQALIDKYPQLPFTWLDFERGGHGVFLLNASLV